MPRCFFHLKNGSEVILDPEGIELADQPSIVARTLKEARSILSHDLQVSGTLPLGYRIEVEDGKGILLHVLEFVDAVSIESGQLPA